MNKCKSTNTMKNLKSKYKYEINKCKYCKYDKSSTNPTFKSKTGKKVILKIRFKYDI